MFHLLAADSEVTLPMLLAFWTGCDVLPPGGFPVQPRVTFFTQEEGIRRLPGSSTCGLVLMLPRGQTDADAFNETMVFVLSNTYGFGKL